MLPRSPAGRPRSAGVVVFPGEFRSVARLVLPVLVEQVLALSVGFTDKWLAGNLFAGAESLAAAGMVAYCLGFLPVVFAVPAVAATAVVARHVGAGEFGLARRAAVQSFLIGGALVVLLLAILLPFGGGFVRSLGLPPDSADLAGRYLAIVLPALPAMMVINVGVAVLRGAGRMSAGLLVMTTVNLVNAALSFGLGVGWGGLPRLGWEGLAWGTFAGYCCGAAGVVLLLSRRRGGLRPRVGDWRPRREWLRRLCRVGLPAGVDGVANAASHLAFLGIVNRLGNVDAAAHSVAITIESLAFLPGSAFQVAAATLAGQFLGARDASRARRSVWLAAVACVVLMSAVGGLFVWSADALVVWFTGGAGRQPEVAALTARLVRVVACVQPPLALLMVLSGGLRGGGATRLPLVVNFLGLIAIRLPLAVFLSCPPGEPPLAIPSLGWGVVGAWYAMAADLAARGIAMLIIFFRVRWWAVKV